MDNKDMTDSSVIPSTIESDTNNIILDITEIKKEPESVSTQESEEYVTALKQE